MFEYTGDEDSTQVSRENFSTKEIIQAVKMLTGLKVKVGELVSPVAGYKSSNHVPEVQILFTLFHPPVPYRLITSLRTYSCFRLIDRVSPIHPPSQLSLKKAHQ